MSYRCFRANKVNGLSSCENDELLSTLRTKLGFEGMIVSDWGAVHHAAAAFGAGLELVINQLKMLVCLDGALSLMHRVGPIFLKLFTFAGSPKVKMIGCMGAWGAGVT